MSLRHPWLTQWWVLGYHELLFKYKCKYARIILRMHPVDERRRLSLAGPMHRMIHEYENIDYMENAPYTQYLLRLPMSLDVGAVKGNYEGIWASPASNYPTIAMLNYHAALVAGITILRPECNGYHFADDTFTRFWWKKRFVFHSQFTGLFLTVSSMINWQWIRWWLGADYATIKSASPMITYRVLV